MKTHRIIQLQYLGLLGVLLLAACASTGGTLPVYQGAATSQEWTPPRVEGDIAQAQGLLNAAFDAARRQDERGIHKQLFQAEETLKKALQVNPHSRQAAVLLGVIYFYKGYYGNENGYHQCVDFLTSVLEVDPYADEAARYLAHANSYLGDEEAVIYYANYVAAVSQKPALIKEMAALKQPYQEAFLNAWYDYGDYYESEASRIREFDPNTYKWNTVLQVTPDYEQRLAAQGFQQLTATTPLLNNDPSRDYLQQLVDRLVARSPVGPPLTYRVDIMLADEVNAFALPGKIVVSTGLLRFVQNEAELVSVLSHELAHIYAHHAARQLVVGEMNKRTVGSVLSMIKVTNDMHRQLIDMGVKAGLELIERGYSRQQEKEADRYGTHIAFNAGYNPTFMTSFFVRLYEANPNHPFRLLATHPPTSDRIEYTSAYLESYPLDMEMQIDSREFQEMKQRFP